MNKHLPKLFGIAALFAAGPLFAGGSAQHSAAAVQASANAVGHGVAASAKLGAAVASVPLQAVGVVGEVSGQAGKALAEWSEADGPLPVSDKPLAAGPSPADMMQR